MLVSLSAIILSSAALLAEAALPKNERQLAGANIGSFLNEKDAWGFDDSGKEVDTGIHSNNLGEERIRRNQYSPRNGHARQGQYHQEWKRGKPSMTTTSPPPAATCPGTWTGTTCNSGGGSDGCTPYTIGNTCSNGINGLTLPPGKTFSDGGHVNYQAIPCSQYKCGQTYKSNSGWTPASFGTHFESLNNQPSGKYIGKSCYDFSGAYNYFGGSYCVTWVQSSDYNQHWGEGGQPPVCQNCQCECEGQVTYNKEAVVKVDNAQFTTSARTTATATATKTTAASAPTPTVGAYLQCGGLLYSGPTTCHNGYHCEGTSLLKTCVPNVGKLQCSANYGQCGGKGWLGTTCCQDGWTCVASGDYFSQCLDV
ncbi:carbohydrate-binding module family 1 protein [Atractiella rhizophila]|nr:carbohydrate-binding module family 1 protein [Atractiella rhizophila]